MKYNLYVKKLPDGQYEAGAHSEDETHFVRRKPTHALTEMAYYIVTKNNS